MRWAMASPCRDSRLSVARMRPSSVPGRRSDLGGDAKNFHQASAIGNWGVLTADTKVTLIAHSTSFGFRVASLVKNSEGIQLTLLLKGHWL